MSGGVFALILYPVTILHVPKTYAIARTVRLPFPLTPMVPSKMPGSETDSQTLTSVFMAADTVSLLASHTCHCRTTDHLVPFSLPEIKSLLYCHLFGQRTEKHLLRQNTQASGWEGRSKHMLFPLKFSLLVRELINHAVA